MKCIIAGSRHVHDRATLDAAIQTCPFASQITEVVCGGALGVDALGDEWAMRAGIPVKYFLISERDGSVKMDHLRNLIEKEGYDFPPLLTSIWWGDGSEQMIGYENGVLAADWGKDGNAAGPIRNRKMAEYADALIAVPLAGDRKGADSMLREATKRGLLIHVREVTHGEYGDRAGAPGGGDGEDQ